MKKWGVRKIIKTVWFSAGLLFIFWNWGTFQSRDLPEGTFSNSADIAVTETSDQIIFQSLTEQSDLQIIFLQGGLTDPKAYGPLCRRLAEKGYTCHLFKMNWRFPEYDYQKVNELLDLPTGNFVIGGHSQGGKMAAQLVYERRGVFKGLFLLGTSHPRDIDLSDDSIPCIKLYAENDGLASVEEVLENRSKLPKGTDLVLIEGGNHSQFGYLGKLFMDGTASISTAEQQRETTDQLLIFLDQIDANRPTGS